MSKTLKVGPLLGVESNELYTVCFLTDASVQQAQVRMAGQLLQAQQLANWAQSIFWRCEWQTLAPKAPQTLAYEVLLDGQVAVDTQGASTWAFYQPAEQESPRLAYASCNGFSDLKLMNTTQNPWAMWQRLKQEHTQLPFSLLLMGGDQVYSDAMWSAVPTLKAWNELTRAKKVQQKPTVLMRKQVEQFFLDLYCKQWTRPDVAYMLAHVPSAMMWDDHDIMDGWGSYPEDLQQCAVYQLVFEMARQFFALFQVRGLHNQSLLRKESSTSTNTAVSLPLSYPSHFSWRLKFRDFEVLALDNRTQRTLNQVMGADQWRDVLAALNACTQTQVLVMTGVPVVYRDFSFTEAALDATPWEEELTDDLKDHWRARAHQGERARLIMNLLANAKVRRVALKQNVRTVLLSGDVHVGCLGVVQDRRETTVTTGENLGVLNIHQVVSSGIVHPAPTQLQWLGIVSTTNDRPEYLDENRLVCAEMLKPFGAPMYLRTRNFATLSLGTDHKLWVNWHCENGEQAAYPLS